MNKHVICLFLLSQTMATTPLPFNDLVITINKGQLIHFVPTQPLPPAPPQELPAFFGPQDVAFSLQEGFYSVRIASLEEIQAKWAEMQAKHLNKKA